MIPIAAANRALLRAVFCSLALGCAEGSELDVTRLNTPLRDGQSELTDLTDITVTLGDAPEPKDLESDASSPATPDGLSLLDASSDTGAVVPADLGPPPCSMRLTRCGAACVDLASSPGHCGRCENPCRTGELCLLGGCNPCGAEGQYCCGLSCNGGFACAGGRCVSNVCVPRCTGRDCGDNGCGGSCGSCGEGTRCGSDGRCACGPSPNWRSVGGRCLPSCGIALDRAGLRDSRGGCCPTGCVGRSAPASWDCANCCENTAGVNACR